MYFHNFALSSKSNRTGLKNDLTYRMTDVDTCSDGVTMKADMPKELL